MTRVDAITVRPATVIRADVSSVVVTASPVVLSRTVVVGSAVVPQGDRALALLENLSDLTTMFEQRLE